MDPAAAGNWLKRGIGTVVLARNPATRAQRLLMKTERAQASRREVGGSRRGGQHQNQTTHCAKHEDRHTYQYSAAAAELRPCF